METSLGTCRIATWPGSTNRVLTLPGDWYEHLRVGERDRIVVWAGNRKTSAEAVFTDEDDVQMSDPLRQTLCLPLGPLAAKSVDGELHFGPFVGLFALPSKEPGKPFGELTSVFQDLMALAREEHVALFVFLPGEVKWEQGMTTAYYYYPDKKHWVRTKRPLPDLVMSKVMAPPPEWRDQVHRDLVQVRMHTPCGTFNRSTGSKWDVHQTLSNCPETRPLLPDTQLIRRPGDVEALLGLHKSVFVKPAMGTQGRAIFRLQRADGRVQVQFTSRGKTYFKRFHHGSDKWNLFLQKTFCGRRAFLVQQALDLLCVQGVRPVDFRWLVQKDGQNEWQVTARVARVGPVNSITTNLHTGGDAVLADALLREHGWHDDKERQQLLRRIDEGAVAIAQALEEKAGAMGEIGIDFAVTKGREVYLIEVNPNPGRQMLKQTSPAARALSLRRNLEYAKYTTGYQP